MPLTSSAIVQDLMILQEAGLASMAYFYFDFRDDNKKSCHNMLLSLLTQLSACSDSCCDVLSRAYEAHKDGQYKPNTITLVTCLKEMLALLGQAPVYIILDALDECPITSGIHPPANKSLIS